MRAWPIYHSKCTPACKSAEVWYSGGNCWSAAGMWTPSINHLRQTEGRRKCTCQSKGTTMNNHTEVKKGLWPNITSGSSWFGLPCCLPCISAALCDCSNNSMQYINVVCMWIYSKAFCLKILVNKLRFPKYGTGECHADCLSQVTETAHRKTEDSKGQTVNLKWTR